MSKKEENEIRCCTNKQINDHKLVEPLWICSSASRKYTCLNDTKHYFQKSFLTSKKLRKCTGQPIILMYSALKVHICYSTNKQPNWNKKKKYPKSVSEKSNVKDYRIGEWFNYNNTDGRLKWLETVARSLTQRCGHQVLIE